MNTTTLERMQTQSPSGMGVALCDRSTNVPFSTPAPVPDADKLLELRHCPGEFGRDIFGQSLSQGLSRSSPSVIF